MSAVNQEDLETDILMLRREDGTRRERVVIDVDGTIADTISYVIQIYNTETGKNYTIEDVTHLDLEKTQLRISPQQLMELYKKAWKDYENIKPLFGLFSLKRLSDCFEIVIASKRPEETVEPLIKWLGKNITGVVYKIEIYDSDDKADKTRNPARFFIDDKPGLVEKNGDLSGDKFLFLIDRPYTPEELKKGTNGHFRIVKDADEAMNLLVEYAENKITLSELKGESARDKSRSTA